ncbi:sigma-54 interaction domain-containing protein [Peribacillus castrilensis]|uniref:Transcriptional regulator n=1 Tax=Peribacillus simplex TaxID=1478 RepID=A0AAN2PH38_9BACI|nr:MULTISPECIES: sigma 54-interacting transcriptional regulator [Peribacillus]MCP1094259.1 sigma 54-interacting transcriptional regulator [Bacillaceae bacterium OS4b]MBD8589133.1 sigma 54-interacting transcriptional regulator [Peribacillus simplex]MCP1152915.1 sigma 54-interacting transcriptional regulator [Peribacillus frigoritolerans]MEA3574747.1 sigma 54-interacting transcriptional regulator [Peribacillus frigoritolerans]NCT38483.1 AAA domain-containing protein [Peribacillus frigoritolerans
MENVKNVIRNWGSIEVDENGKVIGATADFYEYFMIMPTDLIGKSITRIIHTSSSFSLKGLDHKHVFSGVISGHACFIRVFRREADTLYTIIIRQDELEYSDLVYFTNSLEKNKIKKNSVVQGRYSFEEIVGKSKEIERVKELAARIATSSSTVLLTGETGTGKELFAQAIHGLSTRKAQPFVPVNCAAIPDELFESEIFGYEAGAFSGAKKEGKPGKIELAQHGTLFLDEISELPYQAQGKLLRVLQEREVERLGGTGTKNVDIRIIAASNRDLRTLIQEGKFRQDLYYRLYVFELKIPSLRERQEDILPLAHHFVEYFNNKLGSHVKEIDPKLQDWLIQYDWPGNIREIKAIIERGMNIVDGGTLTLESLYFTPNFILEVPSVGINNPFSGTLDEVVGNAEKSAIQRALKDSEGDRSLAAQKLKIHVASLYRKIAKYKLK